MREVMGTDLAEAVRFMQTVNDIRYPVIVKQDDRYVTLRTGEAAPAGDCYCSIWAEESGLVFAEEY
jgi:hypothetical protein